MTGPNGLLRAVLTDPADDLPRLAYADWLEENGDGGRAEFIHKSIRVPHCSFTELTRADPFPLLGLEPGTPALVGGGILRTWMWGETDALGLVVHDLGRGLSYREDRGFISGVLGRLDDFMQHAPTLFACHPITRVVLSDREPSQAILTKQWYWENATGWVDVSVAPRLVPRAILRLLVGGRTVHRGNERRFYLTREVALAALSHACVAWGRQQAGLPHLEG